jgi:aryl-alcohol dehydrogenase-like predicted oxidoreductase
MEYRSIGSLSVSVVGIGCNNFGMRIDEERSAAVVRAALDAGVNLFDTADVYGGTKSEEHLGRALRDLGKRDDAVIATKFGAPGLAPENVSPGSPEWVRQACDASLRRLGVDHIDLYQQHVPDANVPVAETLGALAELVDAGKVREVGCSNYQSKMLVEADDLAQDKGWPRFRTVQNRYSILHRIPERNVTRVCTERDIGLIPYFPLESGLLTGKYRKGEPAPEGTRLAQFPQERAAEFLNDDALDRVERLRAHAESQGHTVLELAMSWLVDNLVVSSVIAGATSPEQVDANVAAVGWALTDADRAAVDDIAPVP